MTPGWLVPRFDWTINPTNLLIIWSFIYGAVRFSVKAVRRMIERLDLHERALLKAGWLRRAPDGELIVRGE